MHDPEHRVVHRLEAFSDVVIGFSLAQTALNLVVPPHAADFVNRPIGIIAFVFTFAVVASFWSTHNAIFRNFFVPYRLMVFVNFVALGAIVLQVFALQLWLHFGQTPTDGVAAARIYFGIFSITFFNLSLLSGLGTLYRWPDLTAALRRDGVRRTIRIGCTALGTALATGVAAGSGSVSILVSGERIVAAPSQFVLGLILGAIAGRIIAWLATRRMPRDA
jgi:hypothetical protein